MINVNRIENVIRCHFFIKILLYTFITSRPAFATQPQSVSAFWPVLIFPAAEELRIQG